MSIEIPTKYAVPIDEPATTENVSDATPSVPTKNAPNPTPTPTPTPIAETAEEHQVALEKKGHREWGLVKNAVKVEKKFHHKHKHKIIASTGFIILGIVLAIVLTLGVAAAVYLTQDPTEPPSTLPTEEEAAEQKLATSAAVNIGKISVVPAVSDEAGSGGKRRLGLFNLVPNQVLSAIQSSASFRGSVRDLAEAEVKFDDVNTDYDTTGANTVVEDGLAEYLTTPNMIVCLLEKVNSAEFMNTGTYIATVDMNLCSTKQVNAKKVRRYVVPTAPVFPCSTLL